MPAGGGEHIKARTGLRLHVPLIREQMLAFAEGNASPLRRRPEILKNFGQPAPALVPEPFNAEEHRLAIFRSAGAPLHSMLREKAAAHLNFRNHRWEIPSDACAAIYARGQ